MSIQESRNYPGLVRSGNGYSYKINQWNALRTKTRLDFKGLSGPSCSNKSQYSPDLKVDMANNHGQLIGQLTFPSLPIENKPLPLDRKSSLRNNLLSTITRSSAKEGGRANELMSLHPNTRAFITGRQQFAEKTPEENIPGQPKRRSCHTPTPSEKSSEGGRKKTPISHSCVFPRNSWFPLNDTYKKRDEAVNKVIHEEQDKVLKRDKEMLPIQRYMEKRFYNYRYSSAGPTYCNKTKKENAIYSCWMVADVAARKELVRKGLKEELNAKEDPKNSCIHPRFLNNSLEASLNMLAKEEGQFDHEKISKKLYVPFKATSEFGRYVTDELHPNWRSDPKLKRKIFYKMRRDSFA